MSIDILNESTLNANGGTELMARALEKKLPPELLEKFQIIPSRVRNLDHNKKRILWLHDLDADPEVQHLANGGYNQFHKLVFVSNWQMQRYIERFGIPWYKCVVLQNAIEPFEQISKPKNGPIRLIYHTTPHRGLQLLAAAFEQLAKEEDVHLDVYSSFSIYGWAERDEPFKQLFNYFDAHPKATYHGAVSNQEVREALKSAEIFAYPSTWLETSCIALIEAMSAGCLCIHPNYGALYETSANWTSMYQFIGNPNDHAALLYRKLKTAIGIVRNDGVQNHLYNQAYYMNHFYSWNIRAEQWIEVLKEI